MNIFQNDDAKLLLFDVFFLQAELNGVEVAVKRVFQDRKYKNREKEIISTLNHQNVVKCKEDFETKGEKVTAILTGVQKIIRIIC